MYFKQFYLGCLAHASYMIGSNGEAAVVDPQRDVEQYLAEAAAQNFKIKYVIETHMHADFVSGHLELAKRTGAVIVVGAKAFAKYPHLAVRDGDTLKVGGVELNFMETPGHTPESVSVVVREPGTTEPLRVLTGDTLFVGDVGRPDLAGSAGFTATQMASMLYDSLRHKLLTLPGETLVYPAHGAGSLCGKALSSKSFSTIAEEKKSNYALQAATREEFIKAVTADQIEAPTYFSRAVQLNREGVDELQKLPRPAALTPSAFQAQAKEPNTLMLDVRESHDFGDGHVPNSINIALAGNFATWAGVFVKPEHRVLLITESEEQVDEAVMRLARVGLHNAVGYLAGGVPEWEAQKLPLEAVPNVAVTKIEAVLGKDIRLLDVRRQGEYDAGHIDGATLIPLDNLATRLKELQGETRPILVYCRSGHRSSTACSLLQAHGFKRVFNLMGGYTAWKAKMAPEPAAT